MYHYIARLRFLGRDFIYSTSGFIEAESEYSAYLKLSDLYPTLIEVVSLERVD